MSPLSNNPNDLQPLTAGHFLIGSPMRCINDQLLPSKVKMWIKLRAIKSEFWQRWSKEYLSELQYRHKWQKERQNIKVGTLVTIKEDNLPLLHWKMGRIETVIRDVNGLIRVVMVKTDSGIVKRAIHELCPLPSEDNANEADSTEHKSDYTTNQEKNLALELQHEMADKPTEGIGNSDEGIARASSTKKCLQPPCSNRQKGRRLNSIPGKRSAIVYSNRVTRSGKQYGATSLFAFYFMIFLGLMATIVGIFGVPCQVTSFNNNP